MASGLVEAMLDLTTTEIADLLVGGALDMVSFRAVGSVPEQFKAQRLYIHMANVTLMRTTPEENAGFGQWLAAKLNRMTGPVRLRLPLGCSSAIDVPGGQPFHDPVFATAHSLGRTGHCQGFRGAPCMERSATAQGPMERIEAVAAFGSAGETGGRTGEVS